MGVMGSADLVSIRKDLNIKLVWYKWWNPSAGTPPSHTSKQELMPGDKGPFVQVLIDKLGLKQPIVFGASWGGSFSLPFSMEATESQILGHIAMAIVGTQLYTPKQYKKNTVGQATA